MEDTKRGHTILVQKPHMNWMTQRCGWESNTKGGLNKTGCAGMNWIHAAQKRNQMCTLVDMVQNVWITQRWRIC